jgi:hypothetical protein
VSNLLIEKEPANEVPVKLYNLDILIKPNKDCRPTLSSETQYRITQYALFHKEHACFICKDPHKAMNVVVIRNELTGITLEAGLDCLEANFPIKRSALFKTASVLDPLIREWVQLVSEIDSSTRQQFFSTNDALQHMLLNFDRIVVLPCKATAEARPLLEGMLTNAGSVGSGYFDSQITSLRIMLAIQREYRFFEKMFEARERYLLDHPYVSSNNIGLIRKIFTDKSPDVELKDFGQLGRLIKTLKRKNLDGKISGFPPYKVPKNLYVTLLRDYLQRLADNLPDTDATIRDLNDVIVEAAESVKSGGAAFVTLADEHFNDVANYEPLTKSGVARELRGLEFYLSPGAIEYEKTGLKI